MAQMQQLLRQPAIPAPLRSGVGVRAAGEYQVQEQINTRSS